MRRILCVIAAALGFAAMPAAGHDIGAMSVTVRAEAGACVVDVLVDLEHSGPASAGSTPEEIGRGIWETSDLWVDGVAGQLTLVESVPDRVDERGVASRVRVAMKCVVPDQVRAVAWQSRLRIGQYLLRVQTGTSDETANQWQEGGRRSREFEMEVTEPGAASVWQVIAMYVPLGFTHIVPEGLDHILFVLGLFLLSLRIRPLLSQVTAFTIAHSITLGLSIYGLVRVPPSIVEPAIAVSIAYVAIENLFVRKYTRWRTAVVFGFGLIHGMGFAGVLRDMGLPRAQFVPALVSFNVGVELGQLAVLLTAFLALGVWFGAKAWYRARITVPASVLIALVGMFWAVQRIV